MSPPGSVSVISVKAPTKLNPRHLYQMDATNNLPPGIIPLAVDHKIDHKYPKLMHITLLNMEHNTVQIQRKTVTGKLQPIDVTDSKANSISRTTDGTTTTDKPAELQWIPPKSTFQSEHNINKHSIVFENGNIP